MKKTSVLRLLFVLLIVAIGSAQADTIDLLNAYRNCTSCQLPGSPGGGANFSRDLLENGSKVIVPMINGGILVLLDGGNPKNKADRDFKNWSDVIEFKGNTLKENSAILFSDASDTEGTLEGFPQQVISDVGTSSNVVFALEASHGNSIYEATNLEKTGTIKWDIHSDPIEPVETTPEPGSFLLFGTGLVGLVPVIRRKLRM